MTRKVHYPGLSMKARTSISQSIIGCLLLSACSTTQAVEDHNEGKMIKEVPLRPSASLVKVPRSPDVPLPSTTTKHLDSVENLIKEPIDQEPNPARNVFFSLGSSDITEEARSTLKKIAEMLKKQRRETVTLVGHTEDLGSREYCIAISSKRADAVEAELLKIGVYQSQIRKRPRGNEAASRKMCHSEACRHNRRRVEILFVEYDTGQRSA